MTLNKDQAKIKLEQLMGRRDALKAEIAAAQADCKKFTDQNLVVEAREADQDLQRLLQRQRLVDQELTKLKKYW